MTIPAWIQSFYQTVDRMDAQGFAERFAEDATFKFANNEPVRGRPAIAGLADSIFKSIKGIAHRAVNVWEHPTATLFEGIVTYTRHDDSQVSIPFMAVYEMRGELVQNYRVYIDATPLHNPGPQA